MIWFGQRQILARHTKGTSLTAPYFQKWFTVVIKIKMYFCIFRSLHVFCVFRGLHVFCIKIAPNYTRSTTCYYQRIGPYIYYLVLIYKLVYGIYVPSYSKPQHRRQCSDKRVGATSPVCWMLALPMHEGRRDQNICGQSVNNYPAHSVYRVWKVSSAVTSMDGISCANYPVVAAWSGLTFCQCRSNW